MNNVVCTLHQSSNRAHTNETVLTQVPTSIMNICHIRLKVSSSACHRANGGCTRPHSSGCRHTRSTIAPPAQACHTPSPPQRSGTRRGTRARSTTEARQGAAPPPSRPTSRAPSRPLSPYAGYSKSHRSSDSPRKGPRCCLKTSRLHGGCAASSQTPARRLPSIKGKCDWRRALDYVCA